MARTITASMPTVLCSRVLLISALLGHALAQDCSQTCESFGTDFVDGQSYFQNINSTDPFTAYEDFTGCQNDTANNILVAPNGDQYECNNTPMTPADTNQLVTCPIDKDQLYSGNWTIIVISNNGECAPIDYMRQFYLSVGVQTTSTVYPSTTVVSTTTPVQTTVVSVTSTFTSQALTPATTTVRTASQSTYTVTPPPTIQASTKALVTITKTSVTASIVAETTITKTTCLATQQVRDRQNRAIAVTVGPKEIQSLASSLVHNNLLPRATPVVRSGGAIIERHIIEHSIPAPKLRVHKRHPDPPTTTVTDFSTTSTIVSTTTAPTMYITGTTTVLRTVTTTSTVTVVAGAPPPTTVTAPRRTATLTFFVPLQVITATVTKPVTQTIVTKTTAC